MEALIRGFWRHLRVRVIFELRDLWVGAYLDTAKRRLYLFPVPTLGVVVEWGEPVADTRRPMWPWHVHDGHGHIYRALESSRHPPGTVEEQPGVIVARLVPTGVDSAGNPTGAL